MFRGNLDGIRDDNDGATQQVPIRTDLETPAKHNHHSMPGDACFDVHHIDTLLEIAYQVTASGDVTALSEWKDACLAAQRAEDIRAVLELIIEDPRKGFAAECLGLAVGIFITESKKETDVAKDYGVSRAAVCKRVMEFRDMIGARSRIMKSDDARKNYRTNKLTTGHWRNQDDRLQKRYKLNLTNSVEKMERMKNGSQSNGNGH